MSALGNQNFLLRSDLEAQISASTGLVLSVNDAYAWLKKKGWMLTNKPYSKDKLAEILFSVALSFELLQDADTVVHSIAYLFCNQAKEILASSTSDKLIDKFANRFSEPINKLNDSVTTA